MKDKEQIQQEAEGIIEIFKTETTIIGNSAIYESIITTGKKTEQSSIKTALIHVEGLINSYKHSIEVVRQTVKGTDKINAIRPLRDRFTELTQMKEYLQSKIK